MVVKEKLFAYFKNKENKYVVLSNGAEVKLVYVSGVSDRKLNLMFEHAYDNINIKFHFHTLVDNTMTTMEIPINPFTSWVPYVLALVFSLKEVMLSKNRE